MTPELGDWLRAHDLGEFEARFVEHEVDLKTLQILTDADLNPAEDMPVSTNRYSFESTPTGTRAIYTSTFASAEELQKVLEMGMVEGATAAIGQIDALVDRLRTDVDELADASVVLTGLRADVVAEESRTITDVEPELALEGLRLVFDRNC